MIRLYESRISIFNNLGCDGVVGESGGAAKVCHSRWKTTVRNQCHRKLSTCLRGIGRSIMDTIKDESPRGSEHEDEGKISSAAILKEKFKPFRCNQQVRWKRTV
ncbi:uncharacterized protein TNIN_34391 [Trichonephila inaurata madagascariensis]|uniref:Uncharacterized protein n=1 Tax=Trichonephila inaurata madagascariensis TaxID=2747483 RepID=A0A8X6X755_9ARAC|nr:uncharacterized protein TNIN_34391 [Trichonephila inaurata madagascariensis]